LIRDVGIEVQTGGRIYIKDLWELLQKWYVETGTLEIEEGSNGKNKLIWHDLPNKYDTPVKAVNQVFARFSEIFPKLQKHNTTNETKWIVKGNGICLELFCKLTLNCKYCFTCQLAHCTEGLQLHQLLLAKKY
jgi:hypothetical protein